MIEDVFSFRFLAITFIGAFLIYTFTKISDFYGIPPDAYMIYIWFYVALYIAWIILPHYIPEF